MISTATHRHDCAKVDSRAQSCAKDQPSRASANERKTSAVEHNHAQKIISQVQAQTGTKEQQARASANERIRLTIKSKRKRAKKVRSRAHRSFFGSSTSVASPEAATSDGDGIGACSGEQWLMSHGSVSGGQHQHELQKNCAGRAWSTR